MKRKCLALILSISLLVSLNLLMVNASAQSSNLKQIVVPLAGHGDHDEW